MLLDCIAYSQPFENDVLILSKSVTFIIVTLFQLTFFLQVTKSAFILSISVSLVTLDFFGHDGLI
jgi:hypothetical protein